MEPAAPEDDRKLIMCSNITMLASTCPLANKLQSSPTHDFKAAALPLEKLRNSCLGERNPCIIQMYTSTALTLLFSCRPSVLFFDLIKLSKYSDYSTIYN